MPRCFFASGSVRASNAPNSAWCAIDVQILCPLISHPPSTLAARVDNDARSDPAPGSLKSWHQGCTPRRIGHGESLALQVGSAVENRRKDPFRDAERGSDQLGPLAELVGDDHLLHRRGANTPRRGQIWRHQTRLRQQVALRSNGQAGGSDVAGIVIVGQPQRLIQCGRHPGTEIRFDVTQVDCRGALYVHANSPAFRVQRVIGPSDAAKLVTRRQYRWVSCSHV